HAPCPGRTEQTAEEDAPRARQVPHHLHPQRGLRLQDHAPLGRPDAGAAPQAPPLTAKKLEPGRPGGRMLEPEPNIPNEGGAMDTYVILRRSGWPNPSELQEAAARSSQVGDEEMSDDIRWIRSYVLEEGGEAVGTVCIYQASSPAAIREHAERADLPVDEIISVADTVIVRPDPEAAEA